MTTIDKLSLVGAAVYKKGQLCEGVTIKSLCDDELLASIINPMKAHLRISPGKTDDQVITLTHEKYPEITYKIVHYVRAHNIEMGSFTNAIRAFGLANRIIDMDLEEVRWSDDDKPLFLCGTSDNFAGKTADEKHLALVHASQYGLRFVRFEPKYVLSPSVKASLRAIKDLWKCCPGGQMPEKSTSGQ